ncbi:MAG TPA: glycosyltransferase family 39 protein, partial [Solirubrobacteraceae bacterium]|nr:glycosyltransferase family 39 protein [Solirubrobacteraceae bacterium]
MPALLGIVLLGAALRFAGLGDQSFWFDEAVTAEVVRPGFGDAFDALKAAESTPPLYYLLGWLWTRVFGEGEAGLRSLSALAGTLTVPVAWAAAREVTSRRGALAAAALVAVNPMLVWYSQEARAYALLALLGGVSLWLCLRARRSGSAGALVAWGVAAALTLLTHYFGIFVVAAEAALLAGAFRRRPASLLAVVPLLAATGAALRALGSAQGDGDRTSWIATIPLDDRVRDVARELFSASTDLIAVNAGRPGAAAGIVGWVAVLAALALGAVALSREDARRAGPVAAVAAAGILVPLALALAGDARDYFLDRNLLAAAVPLAVALGALAGTGSEPGAGGLRRRIAPRLAAGLVAVACLAGLYVDLEVQRRPELGRADWRGIARDLGPPGRDRAIALVPGFAHAPLRVYGRAIAPLPPGGVRVTEVDLVGNFTLGAGSAPRAPAGFAPAGTGERHGVALRRYRAPRRTLVTVATLDAAGLPTDGVVVELGPETLRWVGAYRARLALWARALAGPPARAGLRALRDPALPDLEPVPPALPFAADLHRLALAA